MKKYSNVYLIFLLMIPLVSAYLQRNDGADHIEHRVTIRNFLLTRPFIKSIYNIEGTEGGHSSDNFQARELSYVTDSLDVHTLFFLAEHKMSLWLSLSKYFFEILIIFISWNCFVRRWQMDPLLSFLLIALLLTSPAFFWHGYFHHSAKIGCSFFIFLSLLLMDRSSPLQRNRKTLWLSGALFLTLFAAELYDPQGAFFVLGIVAYCTLSKYLDADHKEDFSRFSLVSSLAFVSYTIYYLYVGPWLIETLNGYVAGFETSKLESKTLLSTLLPKILPCLGLVFDQLRFFLGSLSTPLSMLLVLFLLFLTVFLRRNQFSTRQRSSIFVSHLPFLFLYGVFTAIFVQEVLTSRLAVQMLPIFRRIYYPLPTLAVAFVGISALMREWMKVRPKCLKIAALILCFLVVHNTLMLRETKNLLDEQRPDGRSESLARRMRIFREMRSPCEDVKSKMGKRDYIGNLFLDLMRKENHCS